MTNDETIIKLKKENLQIIEENKKLKRFIYDIKNKLESDGISDTI